MQTGVKSIEMAAPASSSKVSRLPTCAAASTWMMDASLVQLAR